MAERLSLCRWSIPKTPARPGLRHSNLGMYRIQFSGGQYQPNQEVGLHYQIHRGIAVHHAAALAQGQPLRVNIFVGGSPAMSLAAVMPLPEGMSELSVGGALAGRRIDMIDRPGELPIYAEADFTLTGTVESGRTLPEGPFGDHLGYYSLAHDYPVIKIDHVYHRPDPIWPFTVVGRPPQEDTIFGQLIHELTGPAIPTVLPGLHAVHAVDATGVHPLLLAIGSERYVPYASRERPAELLTLANAVLGQGQLSLAKYLWIVAREDNPHARRSRRCRFLAARAGAGRLAARLALSNLFDDRHARLLRLRIERRFETRDRGRRANAPRFADRAGRADAARAAGRSPALPARSAGRPGTGICRQRGRGRRAVGRDDWPARRRPSAQSLSAGGGGRRQRICGSVAVQFSLDHVHPQQSRQPTSTGWAASSKPNIGAAAGRWSIDARAKPHHAPMLAEDPEIERRVELWPLAAGRCSA